MIFQTYSDKIMGSVLGKNAQILGLSQVA